jgi:hypothetical protein
MSGDVVQYSGRVIGNEHGGAMRVVVKDACGTGIASQPRSERKPAKMNNFATLNVYVVESGVSCCPSLLKKPSAP